MQIGHFGNTANNAFYNRLLLQQVTLNGAPVTNNRIVSWTQHAMSDPAWDAIDFMPPSSVFVDRPNWRRVPGATKLRKKNLLHPYSSPRALLVGAVKFLLSPVWTAYRFCRSLLFANYKRIYSWRRWRIGRLEDAATGTPAVGTSRPGRLNMDLHRARTPKFAARARRFISRWENGWTVIDLEAYDRADIAITYGVPSPALMAKNTHNVRICVEHGSLRWLQVGLENDRELRRQYKQFVQKSDHLWVTNVDDISIAIAEELAPNRWSAFPHPYVLDNMTPYLSNSATREAMLVATSSDYLIMSPSSLNWQSDHDKGTAMVLDAFRELRYGGASVGLVLMNWGRNISETRQRLADMNIAQYVFWSDPLPRIALQKMMANCDVVWDQFAYANFGALTLRALEQAVPLITHSVCKNGTRLMGEHPTYLPADTIEQIVSQTMRLYAATQTAPSANIRDNVGQQGRDWLYRRHSHVITKCLQVYRYRQLTAALDTEAAAPNAWALHPDVHSSPRDDVEWLSQSTKKGQEPESN